MTVVDVSETPIGVQVVVQLSGFRQFEESEHYEPTHPQWPRLKAMGQQVCRIRGYWPPGELSSVDKQWDQGFISYQFSWKNNGTRTDSEVVG